MSKKFVYWYLTICGIAGTILGITGIRYLLLFAPVPPDYHLSAPGYLVLTFFVGVLVHSGWVFHLRNQYREPVTD